MNIVSNENLYIPIPVNTKYDIIRKLTGSAATGELKNVTFETFFIGITGVYNLVASKNSTTTTTTGGSNKSKTHKKRDKRRRKGKTMKSKNRVF